MAELSLQSLLCVLNRLLGGRGLKLDYNLPTVKLSLFYEREIPDCETHIDGMCQINNANERKFFINRATDACTAHFNSIQLKNVRRPDRGKNEELVTEHKYAFVFYSTVQVAKATIPIRVCMCAMRSGIIWPLSCKNLEIFFSKMSTFTL